jgi:hypothetical protein
VNDADGLNGRRTDSIPDGGILAALPRTRPQRASARREAARASTASKAKSARTHAANVAPAKTKTSVKPATPKRSAAPRTAATANKAATAKKPTTTGKHRTKPIAKPPEPPAPKQGYEPEEEVELGSTVHPPSGAELLESVADIVGELAGSSFAAGGRLLKDTLSLLRRP